MATLYELTEQYQELLDLMETEGIDPGVIKDTMEAIDGEIEVKADNYAKIMKALEGQVDAINREIDRLDYRAATLKKNSATLKKNLEAAMLATGKKKFKTDLFSFGIQKNPQSLDSVIETKVPARFWKQQKPVLNRTELLAYVKAEEKAGRKCPFATLKQTESLRIK